MIKATVNTDALQRKASDSQTGMDAFAICGIDHTTTTDDDEEHAQVIVDVAVIAADASVEAPWERCVGETNVGFGLRRVGIAVRKASKRLEGDRPSMCMGRT